MSAGTATRAKGGGPRGGRQPGGSRAVPAPHQVPAAFGGTFSTRPRDRAAASGSTGPVALSPAAVAVPSNLSDVVALVDWARGEGWPLTPRGGATGMPGGNVGHGVAVDMASGFGAVTSVDVERMRIRAGVGARMGDVARAARAVGLDLPPMPSSADRCTLGGVLANNAAGARSFRHGSIRPWVTGIEAVLGECTVLELGRNDPSHEALTSLRTSLQADRAWAEGWPRVRKNSSGYALPAFRDSGSARDLLVGSEGTLGILTRAELRLRPPPPARGLHRLALPTARHLAPVAAAADSVKAAACEFLGERFLQLGEVASDPLVGELPRGTWGMALVEVEGTAEEVGEAMLELSQHWAGLGLAFHACTSEAEMADTWGIRRRASPTIARNAGPGLSSVQFIEDSVVPPEHLTRYLEAVAEILSEASLDAVVFGHAGDANVHVNPLVPLADPGIRDRCRRVLERVADLVAVLGGTLTGEHGDGRIRAPLLARIWSDPALDAFRRVKSELDPDGILNPGVILPVAGQDPLEGFGTPRTEGTPT